MELNINSPAYFTNHYGVDDEVYRYCQNLHNYFKTKEYSETLTIIGITPIVAPKEVYNQGLWKEKVQIVSLGTCAMIDVRMDFERIYRLNLMRLLSVQIKKYGGEVLAVMNGRQALRLVPMERNARYVPVQE